MLTFSLCSIPLTLSGCSLALYSSRSTHSQRALTHCCLVPFILSLTDESFPYESAIMKLKNSRNTKSHTISHRVSSLSLSLPARTVQVKDLTAHLRPANDIPPSPATCGSLSPFLFPPSLPLLFPSPTSTENCISEEQAQGRSKWAGCVPARTRTRIPRPGR